MALFPRRLAPIVFIVLMALVMSMVMSLVMTLANAPLDGAILTRWFRAWGISMVVATPTALLVAGPLRRLAERLTR